MVELTDPSLQSVSFPCVLFETQKKMEDYVAEDMRYGDLSESLLKSYFHLNDVSTRVDPWTLTRVSPFNQPHSRFHGSRQQGASVSREACIAILFDEFRALSSFPFAVYSPYKMLIKQMITHMQHGGGVPFENILLDAALKERIVEDKKESNSLEMLRQSILANILWDKGILPEGKRRSIYTDMKECRLPKFNRIKDSFNGMAITVHDIFAAQIIIEDLVIKEGKFTAVIRYNIQDHFGLDNDDILKPHFHQFRFFRIWFVLQRYERFGYKPFMTNMCARVEISGYEHEKQQTL